MFSGEVYVCFRISNPRVNKKARFGGEATGKKSSSLGKKKRVKCYVWSFESESPGGIFAFRSTEGEREKEKEGKESSSFADRDGERIVMEGD